MVEKRRRSRSLPGREGSVCAICKLEDARALVTVDLSGGSRVTLCGTHDLVRRRHFSYETNAEALARLLSERRSGERRGGPGEVDELAELLTAAFTSERRVSARRAG